MIEILVIPPYCKPNVYDYFPKTPMWDIKNRKILVKLPPEEELIFILKWGRQISYEEWYPQVKGTKWKC